MKKIFPKVSCYGCAIKFIPNPFQRHNIKYGKIKKAFCNRLCRYKSMSGPNHPCWVGVGKPRITTNADGIQRRFIRVNGKEIRYARFVVENHIGRKLLNSEIVHHKNLDKLDDRIQNLEVLSVSQHSKHHYPDLKTKLGRKRTGKVVKCALCREKIYRSNWQINKSYSGNLFCDKTCANVFNSPRFSQNSDLYHRNLKN